MKNDFGSPCPLKHKKMFILANLSKIAQNNNRDSGINSKNALVSKLIKILILNCHSVYKPILPVGHHFIAVATNALLFPVWHFAYEMRVFRSF